MVVVVVEGWFAMVVMVVVVVVHDSYDGGGENGTRRTIGCASVGVVGVHHGSGDDDAC